MLPASGGLSLHRTKPPLMCSACRHLQDKDFEGAQDLASRMAASSCGYMARVGFMGWLLWSVHCVALVGGAFLWSGCGVLSCDRSLRAKTFQM